MSPHRPDIHQDVLHDLYTQPRERGVDDVRRRIAQALAQAEPSAQRGAWAARFLAVQRAGFIPAGRIAANAGTPRHASWVNCFVQPIAVPAGARASDAPALQAALDETVDTLRMGGGVGLDFSPLQPEGALIDGSAATASGPVAALQRFDAACQALDASGARRGALMGVLRCDHPDIEAWAAAKAEGGLSHFNLSVGVTDAFMQAVQAGADLPLLHAAEPGATQRAAGAALQPDGRWCWRRVPARRLWQTLVQEAHAHGDPGLLFLDRINADNNLAWCETLAATNPCGEQPLPPYGACCLGSFDLTRFVREPFTPGARFDLAGLRRQVAPAVRLLDNVLELAPWPLPQQQREARAKRRIGLGLTGLGDALVMLGLHYGSPAARAQAQRIARALRDAAYAASVALAVERGAFELFDADALLRPGGFASRLPAALQARIRAHGLRHSHLLCIAPTGSVSLAFADNVSSGIEPVFAWQARRRRRGPAGPVDYSVEDPAARLFRRLHGPGAPLPSAFVDAARLSVPQHLAMVAAVAPFVDGAISKTVNLPASSTPQDFDSLFVNAWRLGLKGITGFRPNPVLDGVLCALPQGAATAMAACPAGRSPGAACR
jgi:ribonucleoside-diphosphate reductase alpha chain